MAVKFEDIQNLVRKIKPFIAIGIFIMMIFAVVGLSHYNKIYTELKDKGYFKQGKATCFCNNNLQNYNPNMSEINNFSNLNNSLTIPIK